LVTQGFPVLNILIQIWYLSTLRQRLGPHQRSRINKWLAERDKGMDTPEGKGILYVYDMNFVFLHFSRLVSHCRHALSLVV